MGPINLAKEFGGVLSAAPTKSRANPAANVF